MKLFLLSFLVLPCCFAAGQAIHPCDSLHIYKSPQVKAAYPGGQDSLVHLIRQNIVYPARARELGISGTFTMLFVVNCEGDICCIQAPDSANKYLAAEATRLIRLCPRLQPAMQDGRLVDSWYQIPFTFTLYGVRHKKKKNNH